MWGRTNRGRRGESSQPRRSLGGEWPRRLKLLLTNLEESDIKTLTRQFQDHAIAIWEIQTYCNIWHCIIANIPIPSRRDVTILADRKVSRWTMTRDKNFVAVHPPTAERYRRFCEKIVYRIRSNILMYDEISENWGCYCTRG